MSINALLVNDTRSEQHVGCQHVVENIVSEAGKVGISIKDTISVSSKNFLSECKEKIKSCDFLLVNGEGSLHHNKDKAREILGTAEYVKSLGMKAVLINTVWQSNSELIKYLEFFDFISCRESLSAREIMASGFNAVVTPDMTFASKLEGVAQTPVLKDMLVLDSVRTKLSKELLGYALKSNLNFLPLSSKGLVKMKKQFLKFGLYKFKGLNVVNEPVSEAIQHLANHEFILSARFHGTCLGMILDKKVISITSNTHKLEGLYGDIGLSPELLLTQEGWRKSNFNYLKELAVSEQPKVKEYVELAPSRIAGMFTEVKKLLN